MSCGEADPRVDKGIGEVGEEAERDVGHRNEQHDRLHDQEVARLDRLHGKLADAGPGEHRLHDDRARQQVADLERGARQAYSGAVLYADYANNLDSCITIRTMELTGDELSVQAGAGIVADSVPALEWEETINKSRALRRAVALAEFEG